jgi:hypothetical protein
MIKSLKLIAYAHLIFLTSDPILAQSFSFPGLRTGNYAGVHSVFFNPALAADSKYIFDLNLFGVNTGIGNNKASFSLNTVGTTFNSNNTLNSLFSGDGRLSGQFQADITGPSLLIRLPKKSGIAFTSRLRSQFSFTDLDGKLVKSILEDVNNEITFPYSITSNQNIRINTNACGEYGVSYGRVLKEDEENLFKVGVTVKYLTGAGNTYIQIDQLSGILTQDPTNPNSSVYLAPGSSGVIGLGISGNTGSLAIGDLINSSSNGFGADIGFVYELKSSNNPKHPYKFRASAAILDIGSIKYDRDLNKSGTFQMLVTTHPGFDLQTLQGVTLNNYKQVLSSNPNFIPSSSNSNPNIKVSLPTSLQVYSDLHLNGNLYVSAGSQISLSKRSEPENTFVYSGFTITPRYEGKAIGLYLPVNYNTLTDLNMGATLRLGPLFIGSGSILSAVFSKSKQADVHVGLHIGILKRAADKPKKTEETQDLPITN